MLFASQDQLREDEGREQRLHQEQQRLQSEEDRRREELRRDKFRLTMMAMILPQQNFGSFSRTCNVSNTTSTPTGKYTSFLVRFDTVKLGFLEKEGLGQYSQEFVSRWTKKVWLLYTKQDCLEL